MRTFLTVAALAMLTSVAAAQVTVEPRAILADTEWRAAYDGYTPVYGLVAAIGSGIDLEGSMTVDVYFADWCDDAKVEVPRFIKLVDELDHADLVVRYFGEIPRKAVGEKYFLTDKKIDRLPTFIFMRNGREVGRIVEHPKEDLLGDILEIVF